MLRAPIWSMSAYSATMLDLVGSITSVTTGSPVASRARPESQTLVRRVPGTQYGEVRGLNAPPRSMSAPAALTARAASSSSSRPSTTHGPAIRTGRSPPISTSPTRMTLRSRCSRDAIMYGLWVRWMFSMPGRASTSSDKVPSTPTIVPPCPSSIDLPSRPSAVAALRRASRVDVGAAAFRMMITVVLLGWWWRGLVDEQVSRATKNRGCLPRFPRLELDLRSYDTGRLTHRRYPPLQLSRGSIGKAIPEPCGNAGSARRNPRHRRGLILVESRRSSPPFVHDKYPTGPLARRQAPLVIVLGTSDVETCAYTALARSRYQASRMRRFKRREGFPAVLPTRHGRPQSAA